MYMEKYIDSLYPDGETIRARYYVEIRVDRETDKYEITITEGKPKKGRFGWRLLNTPILEEYVNMKVDLKDTIEKLIRDWEKPIIDKENLDAWDGYVLPTPDPVPEPPSQTLVESDKMKGKVDPKMIFDWSDPRDIERRRLLEQKQKLS